MTLPDNPACWTWPIPAMVNESVAETRLADLHWFHEHRSPAKRLLRGDARAVWQFAEFHADRCAVCGNVVRAHLFVDHDHWSGLVRGLLCPGCNHLEGNGIYGDQLVFSRYRRRPPARILAYFETYRADGTAQIVLSLRRREGEFRRDVARVHTRLAQLLCHPPLNHEFVFVRGEPTLRPLPAGAARQADEAGPEALAAYNHATRWRRVAKYLERACVQLQAVCKAYVPDADVIDQRFGATDDLLLMACEWLLRLDRSESADLAETVAGARDQLQILRRKARLVQYIEVPKVR